jgi:hypothetical protein
MRFKGRGLLPDTVVWFPEKEFPFFRLAEVTAQCPGWRRRANRSSLSTSAVKRMTNSGQWMRKNYQCCAWNILSRLFLTLNKDFWGVGSYEHLLPILFFLMNMNERQEFERTTHIDNLLSIGRNGEFSHRFMEDVYWRTLKKVHDLVSLDSAFS